MFGMGFTEILIIVVIAILFLGPDKLPSAMINIARFFTQVKKTVGSVKESIEDEMNISEIKQEALAYKRELLEAQNKLEKATDMSDVSAKITNLGDDLIGDIEKPAKQKPKAKEEKVTFEKKNKNNDKEENVDV